MVGIVRLPDSIVLPSVVGTQRIQVIIPAVAGNVGAGAGTEFKAFGQTDFGFHRTQYLIVAAQLVRALHVGHGILPGWLEGIRVEPAAAILLVNIEERRGIQGTHDNPSPSRACIVGRIFRVNRPGRKAGLQLEPWPDFVVEVHPEGITVETGRFYHSLLGKISAGNEVTAFVIST